MNSGLFFDSQEQPFRILQDGVFYEFVIRGLTQKEQEKVATKSTKIQHLPDGKIEIQNIDGSLFIDNFILEGLVSVPDGMNRSLDDIARLKGEIREQLYDQIKSLSDTSRLTTELEKKL